MWDLSGPGIQPLSAELTGGFLVTEPPEKPSTLLSLQTFPALASLLFLQHTGDPLTSGHLHLLSPLPGPLFLLIWLIPSLPSGLNSSITFLMRIFPTVFCEIVNSKTLYFLLSFATLLFLYILTLSNTLYFSYFHFVFFLSSLECKVCFHNCVLV